MSQRRHDLLIIGMVICVAILLAIIPASGAPDTTNSSRLGYEYKVQEDPFFTFAYPMGMTQVITSEKSRNTYRLTTMKKPPVRYLFTSSENVNWAPLDDVALAEYEKTALSDFPLNISNLTKGTPGYTNDGNFSSSFTSYLDTDAKDLIYAIILSNSQSVISAVLVEPAGLYGTEYGNFTLKSLLSITPRDNENGFTFNLAGNDKNMVISNTSSANESGDKDISYDPYTGLFMDTNTGYYYLPAYGVFYNPETGDYYYPTEFGSYDTEYVGNYSGVYTPDGAGTGGYYDSLYSGYTGTSTGYDASGIIEDVSTNRQNTYDAANAMWDDYIRGDQSYAVDSSGYAEPIDTIQEYQEYGLS